MPFEDPLGDTGESREQKYYRLFNWAPGIIYFILDASTYMVEELRTKRGELFRHVGLWGKPFLTAVGLLNVIYGISESVMTHATAAGWFANVLSPFSPLLQGLLLYPNPETHTAKLVGTLAADVGGGGARIAGAFGQ